MFLDEKKKKRKKNSNFLNLKTPENQNAHPSPMLRNGVDI